MPWPFGLPDVSGDLLRRLRHALSKISDFRTLTANIGSVTSIALAGAMLNLLIGRIHGIEGLGVFSQALIFFLVLGQIAAGGFAFSALYYFSRKGADYPESRTFLLATSLPVALVGGVMALGLWLSADMIGAVFGSEALGQVLPAVGLGVFFFGLNKVSAASLNGMAHLKTYAALQALRMPLMLTVFLWQAWIGLSVTKIGWIFAIGEAALFIPSVGLLWSYTPKDDMRAGRIWEHWRSEATVGWHGVLIGLLSDLNTKVDILILSLFATDTVVGIYALGAMFADGLLMVLAAVQNIVNPRLPEIIVSRRRDRLDDLIATASQIGRPLSLLIIAVGSAIMLLIAPVILQIPDVVASTMVFTVIGLGAVVGAPAIILNQVFTQGGHPGLQTAFFLTIALTNLALNLVLVPLFGPIGAASATAIAEIGQLFLMKRWLPRLFAAQR